MRFLRQQGPHSAILRASLRSSRAARQPAFNNRQPCVGTDHLADLTFAAHSHQPPEWVYEIGCRAMPGMRVVPGLGGPCGGITLWPRHRRFQPDSTSGAHLRRPRRGAQVHRRPTGPQALSAERSVDRPRPNPPHQRTHPLRRLSLRVSC
jgi:hypothetical protein